MTMRRQQVTDKEPQPPRRRGSRRVVPIVAAASLVTVHLTSQLGGDTRSTDESRTRAAAEQQTPPLGVTVADERRLAVRGIVAHAGDRFELRAVYEFTCATQLRESEELTLTYDYLTLHPDRGLSAGNGVVAFDVPGETCNEQLQAAYADQSSALVESVASVIAQDAAAFDMPTDGSLQDTLSAVTTAQQNGVRFVHQDLSW
jgi:hypothetical protein